MKKTIGFIGSGNMGSAIIGGIVRSNLVSPEQILAADISQAALQELHTDYGIRTTTENRQVAMEADILFLSVKPPLYPVVIEEIKTVMRESTVVVVIAAGQTLQHMDAAFGRPIKVVRTMPNTPAMVNEGMSAICPNERITPDELAEVCAIFSSFGKAEVVTEAMLDIVTGVSGSSPAYIYMLIEAMADAAVAGGMPRKQAYTFVAQAVLGSAKMVLETGKHPGELKDMVCTPGGTTIDAVVELEKQGFRQAVMSAVKVCADKSKKMSENK